MKDLKGWIAPIDKAEADSLARKIAHLYLNKFPRLYSYGVKLVSSEDDSEGTFYFKLNNEELEEDGWFDCSDIEFDEHNISDFDNFMFNDDYW